MIVQISNPLSTVVMVGSLTHSLHSYKLLHPFSVVIVS